MLVVAQKAVSKAEGRVVRLDDVEPSPRALELADDRDPRHVEWILRESAHVVRVRPPLIISETRHGFVCASAGVDASNAKGEGTLILLPLDPDASAARIRERIRERTGRDVGVIVSDSFGRPFRQGTTDVALGVAGLTPLLDLRGVRDRLGYELQATQIAVADELAAAAELVMGKVERDPGRADPRRRLPRRRHRRRHPDPRGARPLPLEHFERQRGEALPDHRRELEAVAAAGGADDDPAAALEQELVVLADRVEARLDARRRLEPEAARDPGCGPRCELAVGRVRLVGVRRPARLVQARLQRAAGRCSA